MTTIRLVSPKHFELWDWRNPDHPGIGGSETMHCEMAWRLAARGHEVISYAPVPPESHHQRHRGVLWRHLADVDLDSHEPGLWILVRGLHWLDRIAGTSEQRVWCVFQDVDEDQRIWDEQAAQLWKLQRLVTLCETHQGYLQARHLPLMDRIVLSRNGFRGDLVDAVLQESLPRSPYRLTFASSPDRGLYGLLRAFRLIKFMVPEAELHVMYGFDNIEKLGHVEAIASNIRRLRREMQQPGVVERGRMGQADLYREWAQTGIWCNPANFLETGCITAMEAQALGAIPVLNPLWAAGENLITGIGIEGDAERSDMNTRRYAMACVYLMQHPELQEELRGPMMAEARKRFDWEGVAEQYEQWIEEDGL